jgi:hypothetical protein
VIGEVKLSILKIVLPACQFIHHRFYTDRPEIELMSSR